MSGVFATISTFITGTLIPAIVGLVSTFGLPIAIIGALVGAGYLLIKNWDSVKEGAKALGESFSKIWTNIKDVCLETFGGIGESLKGLWEGIIENASIIFEGLKSVFIEKFKAITEVTTSIWKGISDILSGIWNGLYSGIIKPILTTIIAFIFSFPFEKIV